MAFAPPPVWFALPADAAVLVLRRAGQGGGVTALPARAGPVVGRIRNPGRPEVGTLINPGPPRLHMGFGLVTLTGGSDLGADRIIGEAELTAQS
jgi:hypothetical protein